MDTDREPAHETGFEESFERLETIVRELERGELTLDESMARYEEGVGRLKECYRQLKAAEARVLVLVEKEGGRVEAEEIDFRPAGDPVDEPTGEESS